MTHLHPFTVQTQESAPTTDELLSDSNVRTLGNNYEGAVAIQEQAEAEWAGQQLDDDTAAEIDAWTAHAELMNVYHRRGRAAFNTALLRAERQVIAEESADLRSSTAKVVNAVRDFVAADPNINPALAAVFA